MDEAAAISWETLPIIPILMPHLGFTVHWRFISQRGQHRL